MSVIYIVVPLALIVVLVALGAYLWAVRSGQMDDLDTPPLRALFEDEESPGKRQAQVQSEGGQGIQEPEGTGSGPPEEPR